MRIVRLPGDRLRVPVAVSGDDYDADATETIGPDDRRYPEYEPLARTEEEHAAREEGAEIASAELFVRWNARYENQQDQRRA
jgi:hypothetical protein